ncbi:TPA: hypothetical protein DCW38_01475 [candidate division WOR-3 bacterium]|jgi:hypothetical protein|uniref:Lipoprotein n=1 Tax=candidate division WOR-3 bacterium TaxID=2052148 RepID=A0A350H8H1_UNCW3|nr:hypothetical protein [candidate division WOR-3 bacterium]
MNKNLIAIILFSFCLSSCTLMSNADEGTIVYYGFDFSSGYLNSNFEKNDIISLIDYNPSLETSEREMYIYLLLDTLSLRQNLKDYGVVPFNSIDRISSSMEFDSISSPIDVGHLYVMKCKDGFAKFRVMSISGATLFKKEIRMVYEFTPDSEF